MQAPALTQNTLRNEDTFEWQNVCTLSDLIPNSGVCALVEGLQIAIFWVASKEQQACSLYGISNFDPIGKANVICRGIIGSIGDEPVVASPLYKQHFSLITGQCIEAPEHSLRIFAVRLVNTNVQISMLPMPMSVTSVSANEQTTS
ncbi:nitrite reductase small subunit NirD [Glaciecola sp. SC05]|uniref:nitrite reductase small subunit NirD n=1 Tax=Glaciecola sp. SC05 TaxID=1987355 RepID=UPI0035291F3B